MATTRTPGPPVQQGPGRDPRRPETGPRTVLGSGQRRWLLLLVAGVVLLSAGGVAFAFAGNGPGRHGHASGPHQAPQSAGGQPSGSSTPSPSTGPSASGTPSASVKPTSTPTKAATGPGVSIIDPGRAGCAAKPSACGLPDATNTGVPAGTSLTAYSGPTVIKTSGYVIDGKIVNSCIRVMAPGVVIRRSKITCQDFITVASFGGEYSGTGLVIEDSELICTGGGTAVGDTNVTVRRVNIHGCENGFDINSSFTVQDSYIHDLFESDSSHTDGAQLAGGSHITINHNTIFDNNGTSAIISDPSDNANVVISNNLMAGGAYTLYCPQDRSQDFHVVGNRFSKLFFPQSGAYGPWTDCEKVAENRGNIWDDTLAPVS